MNALTLLTNDHRRVDRLFVEHARAAGNPRRQKALFEDVRRELDVHTQIEGKVFYPALEGNFVTPLKEQLEEARAEHEEVNSLLKQLAAVAPEDAGYGITFTKLIDAVRQHVKEEEGEMFPAAREVLGAARLEELGREMAEMKPQLASGIAEAVTSAVKAVKRVVAGPTTRRPAKAVARRATRAGAFSGARGSARSTPGTPRRSGGGLPRSSARRRG